jgi:hypothetical protein
VNRIPANRRRLSALPGCGGFEGGNRIRLKLAQAGLEQPPAQLTGGHAAGEALSYQIVDVDRRF